MVLGVMRSMHSWGWGNSTVRTSVLNLKANCKSHAFSYLVRSNHAWDLSSEWSEQSHTWGEMHLMMQTVGCWGRRVGVCGKAPPSEHLLGSVIHQRATRGHPRPAWRVWTSPVVHRLLRTQRYFCGPVGPKSWKQPPGLLKKAPGSLTEG